MTEPPPKIRLTTTTRLVLDLFLATDPDNPLWGYRITEETGLGPVYPLLERLEKAGWITGSWETGLPEDRPRRRFHSRPWRRSRHRLPSESQQRERPQRRPAPIVDHRTPPLPKCPRHRQGLTRFSWRVTGSHAGGMVAAV